MRRRELLAVPGVAGVAAFAAARAMAETPDTTLNGSAMKVSRKALVKETHVKGAYKLPKNAAKQTRYLASLTALLSLDPVQRQQGNTIFAAAINKHIGIQASIKSARKVLNAAVKNNDSAGIAQAASEIGSLTSEYVANGANAHAAFYQILTPAQQTTLAQYQGHTSTTTAA